MRFFVRSLSAAVLAAILTGGSAPAGATPPAAGAGASGVEIARNEAENNAKSPAGKRYEGTLLGKVFEWLRPVVEKCAKDVPPEERISFDALIRVGADGKAQEVLFGPDTAVAKCVAPTFTDQTYPRPPEPSWWVKLEVRMK